MSAKKVYIKPINRILLVVLTILVLAIPIAVIIKNSMREQTTPGGGDLVIFNLEQRILDYEINGDASSEDADAIASEMLDYISQIQETSPDIASAGRVILADFYSFQRRYADAIDILEEDLAYEIPQERRYVVYARLIDIYEHTHQTYKEKQYLELLLAMEDVHPQYESWEAIRESYQAKLDTLELPYE